MRIASMVLALVMGISAPAGAQTDSVRPLVDAEWLMANAGEENVVILDIRDDIEGTDPGSAPYIEGAEATFELGDRRFRVVHGSVATTNRFMFASLPEAEFAGELGRISDAVIAGHTGLPFTRTLGDRLWHNPGSLGLPANDGTPRGWYSVLEPAGNGVRLRHLSFRYEHDAAAAKMRTAGLPEGYAACLETGLWPSLDVLPEAERAATGQALVEHVRDWPSARSSLQASAAVIQAAPMIGPVPST